MSQPWARAAAAGADRERIAATPHSFGVDVWLRFAKKPTALAGLIAVLLLLACALIGPSLSPYSYDKQTLSLAGVPPVFTAVVAPEAGRYFYITPNQKIIEVDDQGRLLRQLPMAQDLFMEKRVSYRCGPQDEGLVYLDYSAAKPALLDEAGNPLAATRVLWNRTYLLGTDHLGRDILTRLMYGAQISLMVAFIAAAVNMVIGTLYGGIAGYLGGRVDAIMMRVVDIISTIPLTLYVILIKVCLAGGLVGIIVALSSVYWVDMARVVRGQVLSLKQQEFVLAARTIGSGTRRILLTHLIPNAMGSILVTATMLIPSAIFMEAFMSFIGIGIAPPMASLGTMCNDATEALRSSPYQLFLPALIICLIMFAFNFVGDGLRDSLDPQLKR
ncbi:MAG: ABC transporter permease [Oscillospiraceae bacterium]|jgi:oligopeptide transport system permease protein|nr:ABC transporter permease [Oscillospiraceae bacterium]